MSPRVRQASDVLVAAPVLASKLHLWTNDTDCAREQADAGLNAVLGGVEAIGSDADTSGFVGDEVDDCRSIAGSRCTGWGRHKGVTESRT
jgi:hypothetical protein